MRLVVLTLVFTLGCVCSGPIDDGLLPQQSSRQVGGGGGDDDVDAVVVDVGRPRRPYDMPRRRFLGPFFDRDDDDDDDAGFGPSPAFGFRPYGWGFGHRPYYGGGGGGGGFAYRPYADDFFTRLREQMDAVRRYLNTIFNVSGTTSDFGPFDHLPPNYDNSTYTTKVVNGSVISVNETVKKHSTNDSSFVFKFKVVQVRPHNETNPEDGGNEEPVFPGPVVPEKTDEPPQSTPVPAADQSTTVAIDTENEMDNDVSLGRQFR